MARQIGSRSLARRSGRSQYLIGMRPSRRPLRGLLRMNDFLNAIKGLHHPEERPEGASRRTHDSIAALTAAALSTALIALPAIADEEPKYGGALTYMIPADAPPSFDGHRESTYATVHSVAPFYSVLIRVDPENPADITRFVCDLCTEMPQLTDGGTTYTFKIRQDVKFHDGSPLTAADVGRATRRSSFPPMAS